MNNADTTSISSRIRSLIDSIAAWLRGLAHRDQSLSEGMLLDEDPYPASNALSDIHERPVFHVDKESAREFALLEDLEDGGELKASDTRPRAMSESESGQARFDR